MILVYSITPIHVGAGRAVGVVDLPIQRDALGYPVIFSSSFKGALKALCAGNKITTDEGRINCSEAKLCCCVFGSEPLGSESETGVLTLTDLIPLAVPVPAAEDVYLYLTSPYLLRKIKDILDAEKFKSKDENLGTFHELISAILNALERKQNGHVTLGDVREIFVGDKVKEIKIPEREKALELLRGLGTLTSNIEKRLVVMESGDDRYLFDKATVKVTRNRIMLSTKTVREGALWTEEYLPEGTIFVGGYLISSRKNSFCNSASIEEIVKKVKQEHFSNGTFYLNLGGKESIGKGLVKVNWW